MSEEKGDGRRGGAGKTKHLFQEQAVKFVPAVLDPETVRGVHDPDKGIRFLEVVAPVGPERLLASYIPWGWLARGISSVCSGVESHTYVELISTIVNNCQYARNKDHRRTG